MANYSYRYNYGSNYRVRLLAKFRLFKDMMEYVNMSIYCFGFLSNILILWMFFTDGFASSSNINFFALGGADLCVCFIFIVEEIIWTWFYRKCFQNNACRTLRNIWSVYFFPNQEAIKSFSAWITAVITLERLLCVAFPMKVKRLITPKRTACMVLGYLTYILTTALAYNILRWWHKSLMYDDSNYYVTGYDTKRNISYYGMLPSVVKIYNTVLRVHKTGRMAMVKMLNPVLYGTILMATILLIIAFKRSIQVRKSLTDKTKTGNSVKERRLVQSVIAVCIIFLVTAGPKNIVKLMDDVGYLWQDHNSWRISLGWTKANFVDEMTVFLEALNHSINIFVYLSMNTKFRGRFKGLFGLTNVRGVSNVKKTVPVYSKN